MVLKPIVQMTVAASIAHSLPLQIETRAPLTSRVSNIHVAFLEPVEGSIDFTYGSCDQQHVIDSHHLIANAPSATYNRLVWVVPKDMYSDGCISAWDHNTGLLLGRSDKQHFDFELIQQRRNLRLSRRNNDPNSISMDNSTGVDVWGPWFDGVELLRNSECSPIDAETAKRKNIAIVGAGMAGLMSYLCLTQQGMSNVSLIEGGDRLGGRVHTVYLSGGPFDYSYQEMGPMRLPLTLTVGNETYNMSDHQLVFQLAEEMNRINEGDEEFNIDFITWYESGGSRLPHDGGSRRVGDIPIQQIPSPANSSLASGSPGLSIEEIFDRINKALPCKDFCVEMATNMFKAHRRWLDRGLFDLEFAFISEYLNNNANDTRFGYWGRGASSFWDKLYEDLYLNTTEWRTINGGMSRLPLSFGPLVEDDITFGRRINKVAYSTENRTVTLESPSDDHPYESVISTHDYVLLTAPFSAMRNWEISGLGNVMMDAINSLPYTSACKIAMEFKTRFWEHLEDPIYGSCWAAGPDYPGIGTICYPSYNINGTGRGAILGSYISDPDWTERWIELSEQDHVSYALGAILGIHGDVVKQQYTGRYSRVCGALDPLEGASWADPTVGQHQIYLPEYFKTHNNMIFIGEHTSYTHAWIASALESGVRGSVQLLLELGLVDEAKATAEKWMGRWIDLRKERGYML
ncbi:putative L-amino-acid oxidase [Cladorrhinum sp. PSN259]|nr:putative L-amino-acid oxidase [Cladorrhinum sp. PSN259]